MLVDSGRAAFIDTGTNFAVPRLLAALAFVTGHTHGGQIKLPKITAHLLRRMGQPYERGLHHVNGNHVYVNRGLGYGIGSVALRLGSRPEVSYFTLHAH